MDLPISQERAGDMNQRNICRIVYGIVFVLGALAVWHFFQGDIQCNHINESKLQILEFNGTFITEDNMVPQKVTLEALEAAGTAEYLVAKGHLNYPVEKNEQMFLYLNRVSAEVYKNGKLVFSHGGEEDHLPIVKSSGNVWVSFYSDGVSTEDELEIRFHSPYPGHSADVYSDCLRRFYSGDRMQVFLHMAEKNSYTIIACMIIFILGIALFVLGVTVRILGIPKMDSIFHGGVLFLVSGTWLLIDYSYISLIFPYGMTLDVLNILSMLCIPALGLHYVRAYARTKMKNALFAGEMFLMLICFVFLILQNKGIWDSEMMRNASLRFMLFVLLIFFVCLVLEYRYNKDKNARIVMLSAIILLVTGVIGNALFNITNFYGASLFGIGLVSFLIMQYILVIRNIWIQNKEMEQKKKLEREMTENRISIMLSQIQPHFLYNSISSIQELCLMDQEKACDALAQFAHFLRGNMDSLTCTKPIEFEREMSHVKNYLALEKIRFEERLSIEYNIEEDDFLIPALTLQPIVENAVRYGVSKKKAGGTVKISTYRKENDIVIEVADDGKGFQTESKHSVVDERSHVGLENVRKRLKMQCGGKLEIVSSEEGSTVKILIPQAEQEIENAKISRGYTAKGVVEAVAALRRVWYNGLRRK